jgi:hypothetical protein
VPSWSKMRRGILNCDDVGYKWKFKFRIENRAENERDDAGLAFALAALAFALKRNYDENEMRKQWNDESFNHITIRINVRYPLDGDSISSWDIFVCPTSLFPSFDFFVESSVHLNSSNVSWVRPIHFWISFDSIIDSVFHSFAHAFIHSFNYFFIQGCWFALKK